MSIDGAREGGWGCLSGPTQLARVEGVAQADGVVGDVAHEGAVRLEPPDHAHFLAEGL